MSGKLDEPKEPHQCVACGQAFENEQRLMEHKKEKHIGQQARM
jgi:hypothetical protein